MRFIGLVFFHESTPNRSLVNVKKLFNIFSRIRGDIRAEFKKKLFLKQGPKWGRSIKKAARGRKFYGTGFAAVFFSGDLGRYVRYLSMC